MPCTRGDSSRALVASEQQDIALGKLLVEGTELDVQIAEIMDPHAAFLAFAINQS